MATTLVVSSIVYPLALTIAFIVVIVVVALIASIVLVKSSKCFI